jgi:hypothetical protein
MHSEGIADLGGMDCGEGWSLSLTSMPKYGELGGVRRLLNMLKGSNDSDNAAETSEALRCFSSRGESRFSFCVWQGPGPTLRNGVSRSEYARNREQRSFLCLSAEVAVDSTRYRYVHAIFVDTDLVGVPITRP